MKKLLIILLSLMAFPPLFAQDFAVVNITQHLESPSDLALLDANNDNLTDIWVSGLEEFLIYENSPSGEFVKHSIGDTLSYFRRFDFVDWENDGDTDVILSYDNWYGGEGVAWLENLGNYQFQPHILIDTVMDPYDVKAFDIDNDGDLDVLFTSVETDELYWLVNDGTGNFTQLDTIGQYINRFEIADLHGDGDWDIIFPRAYTGFTISEVRAFVNDGTNQFTMQTLKGGFSVLHEIILDDMNNDGYFDILLGDYNSDVLVWLRNDGQYNFYNQFVIHQNFDGVESYDVKDVNQDGIKDVIAASYNSDEIYYYQGSGSGLSYALSAGTLIGEDLVGVSGLAIGDLDQTGNLDFVLIDGSADKLSVFLNDGNQQFTENALAFSFDSPRAFDMGDLDGDGDQDVAAVSNDGDMVAWMENMGNDIFKTHILLTNYEEPYMVRLVDLDQDGDLDIIAASDYDDRITWWKNDGFGNFTLIHISTNINGPRDFWITDVDNDGDLDIAVMCYWLYTQSGNTGAQLLINDGNENFTISPISASFRAGSSIRSADFNGDGQMDFALSAYYYTSSQLKIAANFSGAFSLVTLDNIQIQSMEVLDWDDDNDPDILAIDFVNDSLYFYENLGNWQFQRHTLLHYPDLYQFSVLDVDNDGDRDILFSSGYSGFTNSAHFEWGLFRNEGTGGFVPELYAENLSMLKPMQVVDYENDGDWDVMLGFDYQDKIVLYKNLEIDCPLSVSAAANGPLTFCQGGSVELEATSNQTTVHYQWLLNQIPLEGDTLPQISASLSGSYQVEISDSVCSVTSAPILVEAVLNDTTHVQAEVCSGANFVFQNDTLQIPGTYTYQLLDQFSCDSIVQLEIVHHPVDTTILVESICSGDTLNYLGTAYTQGGQYEILLQNQFQCDSLIQLELSENPVYATAETLSLCEGTVYDFHGQQLTQAGTYQAFFTTTAGCDSVFELELNYHPVDTTVLAESICSGDTLNYLGTAYTHGGQYEILLQNQFQCDSLIQLELSENPVYATVEALSLCEGTAYDFHGQQLTQAGTYQAFFTTTAGCDSVFELELNYHPVDTTVLAESICSGDTLNYLGTAYTQGGQYEILLQNQFQCDSLIQLELSENPVYATVEALSLCIGTAYDFHGQQLTQAGTYQAFFTTTAGCDSVFELELNYHPVDTIQVFESVCAGDTVMFQGTTYSEAGTYEVWLQNQFMCDSLVEFHLSHYPLPIVDLGPDTTVFDTTSIQLSVDPNYQSYLWSTGETSSAIVFNAIAAAPGDYTIAVEVTSEHSCVASDSILITVEDWVQVEEMVMDRWKVYPNPVEDILYCQSLTVSGPAAVFLYDEFGRLLFQLEDQLSEVQIDLSNYAAGKYYLEIRTATYREQTVIVKLSKQ